jgi:hypothetical protein
MTTMHAPRQLSSQPLAGTVAAGVASGFAGTFTAVLTFSVLLAALGVLSISRFAGGAR